MKKRLSGCFLALFFSVILLWPQNNLFAAEKYDSAAVKKCANFLTYAVVELAEKTSPAKPSITYIVATNDISYDPADNVCMANVLARTIISQNKSFYGIFLRIRFTPYFGKEGVWAPIAEIEAYSEDWKPLLDTKEAKTKWCELINLVYPSEAYEQSCQ